MKKLSRLAPRLESSKAYGSQVDCEAMVDTCMLHLTEHPLVTPASI